MAPLPRAGLRITLSKAWHQLCHTSRVPVEELAALRMLFLTRQEDPDTPMEVRAILLPATRVPASRARVRRGQADSGSWPSKVEASRRHLRRGGVHAREADGRFKRSELREPAVGRWVDWAAPWPTGPDPRCQLGQHHPYSRCLFLCGPPSRFGGALEGRDLPWLYACSRSWCPNTEPTPGSRDGEAEQHGGRRLWVGALPSALRELLLSGTLAKPG